MASTALNSRILEAMVTSRPETTESSPLNGQDVPSAYLAQYTATLEDFARRNGDMIPVSPSGGDVSTEEDEGSYDDNSSGQKSSISSPVDPGKKRRKQSKPSKIGGCSDNGSLGAEDIEKENVDKARDHSIETESSDCQNPEKHNEEKLFLRCPHCQLNVDSHDDLRKHIIEEHIGRMLTGEEIVLRHAQQAKQKLIEHQQQQHQQQQYQQRFLAETIRIHEELRERHREGREQQFQQHPLHQNHPILTSNKSPSREQQQQLVQQSDVAQFPEREEGETGPLNLSNTRWGDVSRPPSQTQDSQRSPVTPLPASIPMPPSFADARFNLPGFLPFGPPPFLLPFMQQGDRENLLNNSGQQGGFNSVQSRIFNLEAFCDLCNKEFCNKYFLKTHKANKHGIFTPELSCSPMPPTPPTPLGPSAPLSHSTPLMAPLIHSPMTPTSIGSSPYAGAFLTANLGNLVLRPPHPPQLQTNTKPPSMPVKNESSSISKTGVINLDAYCELCQKEFCNKYFLKRHKLKIHGVNIEVTIKSPKTNPALDRPEGWCDACRRDIGSRSSLNAHKLHSHGPHIVNNITATNEPSPRHPIYSRPFNSIPLKPNNGERELKDNFSPWDMMRERGPLESSLHWKALNKQGEVSISFHNEQNHVENIVQENGKEIHSNEVPNKTNPAVSIHSVILESIHKNENRKMDEPMKVKIPPLSDSSIIQEGVQIKLEEKSMNDGREPILNRNDADNDPPMPILKPQTECHKDLEITTNGHDQEERPPPLLREQSNPQNRMEGLSPADHGPNTSEPPRTPGGASNSTDDSSREAGIIARVGQPAIVQAPPGTKFTPDQLRQLGVINPDAFCELCCKEFCNKYFLRTHRIKKHNIYTPEYSERSKQQFKESSPINLARIFERQAVEFRPPNLSDNEMEIECDICRRPFPNPHLLYMHKCYFHGLNPETVLPENLSLREHLLPHEQLRQLALQAHEQKLQDHQQLLMRYHKQQQQQQQQQHQQQQQQHQHQLQQQQQQHQQRQLQLNIQQEQDQHRKQLDDQLQGQNPIDLQDFQRVKNEIESHIENSKDKGGLDREVEDKEVKREDIDLQNKNNRSTKIPQVSPGVPENSNGSEADTSQELRKLQSMILELNRQGDEAIQCKVCQKEIGNKYFLRAHMMSEHGILVQEDHNSESAQTPKTPFELNERMTPLGSMSTDSQAYCDLCKKDFFSRYILQQHMLSSHGIFTQHPGPTSFLDRIRAEVEGRDDRKPQSVSRSFCDICNKELCNKYFMKTHMLKMHGINIENGTSGGVTCDLCNKELCSKYFLKVHRQNTHGLVEDIRDPKDMKDGIFKERRDSEETPEDISAIEICPMCQRKFKNIKWLRTHLTQDHGEDGKVKWREIESTLPPMEILSRSIPSCSFCGENQTDVVALQIHLIKHHSSKSIEDFQNESNSDDAQHCSLCPFTCNSPGLLAAHERSHSPQMPNITDDSNSPIQCHMCSELVPNTDTYRQHLIGHQLQGLFEPLLPKHFDDNNDRIVAMPNVATSILSARSTRDLFMSRAHTKSRRRYRCRRCKMSFNTRSSCLVHIFRKHTQRPRNFYSNRQIWQRKNFRCSRCGVSEKRLSDLIAHMRNHNHSKRGTSLPIVHAHPIDLDTPKDNFVMQSFLMNRDDLGNMETDEAEFVPSLVNLPVSRRVQRVLTVSFTLTPT